MPRRTAESRSTSLNNALPGEVSPDQIDDLIGALAKRGINVARETGKGEAGTDGAATDDAGADDAGADDKASSKDGKDAKASKDGKDAKATKDGKEGEEEESEGPVTIGEADLGRTDDPVRMYLREMGTIELLTREGEIEIAQAY